MPITAFIDMISLSRVPIRYIDGKPKHQHALRRSWQLRADWAVWAISWRRNRHRS